VNRALLIRSPSTDQGTFGALNFGSAKVFTTELPWRDNRSQRSCVPVGEYQCVLVDSPKFGHVYTLLNVPKRSAVLIHSANFGGDVDLGWTTELHGCIAPSMRRGLMRNNAGQMQMAGIVSRPALNKFTDWADGRPFILEIK
jgi:hypothetical protein